MRRKTFVLTAVIAIGVVLAGPASAVASSRGAVRSHTSTGRSRIAHQGDSTDWPTFLYTNTHSDDASPMDAVTTSNAASLTQAWTWMPPAPPLAALGEALISSPTVYDGVIYIGANNGSFYALNESTGAVIWSDFIGYVTYSTCKAQGFAATASVATDPVTGDLMVYVNAPNGYLYALNAATGAVVWQSVVGIPAKHQNNYYAWSSTAVANGTVYVGITSMCDDPLIYGGLLAFNQSTGAQTASFYNVPAGDIGGSVWSSPAVDANGTVFISTGNGSDDNQVLGTSESILALDPSTLDMTDGWQAPNGKYGDEDFGASPTIWSAVLPGQTEPTEMVGALNKNGLFFALNAGDLSAGPLWHVSVGPTKTGLISYQDTSAAAWNGTDLFLAGPQSTIKKKNYKGSIRAVNPATGALIWVTGLPAGVQGAPTLDGAGVLAVATYDIHGAPNAVYLLDASTGAILATLNDDDSSEFATPVFAGPYLFLATLSAGLIAYEAPSGDSSVPALGRPHAAGWTSLTNPKR